MKRKYFGTDGIRGKVGEAPITPDFVMKLGWAAGRILSRGGKGKPKVLIGKDTRVSKRKRHNSPTKKKKKILKCQ